MSWLLYHWVKRPTGAQTSHSFSMASALGICQIPVSRLWPFPDRAKCWPLAQSPRVKPECETGLLGIHGLPLSPVHPGSLNIPSGGFPNSKTGGRVGLYLPENRGRSYFWLDTEGAGEAWVPDVGGGTSSRVGTRFPRSVWPSVSPARPVPTKQDCGWRVLTGGRPRPHQVAQVSLQGPTLPPCPWVCPSGDGPSPVLGSRCGGMELDGQSSHPNSRKDFWFLYTDVACAKATSSW